MALFLLAPSVSCPKRGGGGCDSAMGKVLYSWQHLQSHLDGALGTEGTIEAASRVQGFTSRPVANEMDASLRLT